MFTLRMLLGAMLLASLPVAAPTTAEPQASIPELMARIEGPQSPNRKDSTLSQSGKS